MNTYLAYIQLPDGTYIDETVWADSEIVAREEIEYLYRETAISITLSEYEEVAE
jgi:hypothetical protein